MKYTNEPPELPAKFFDVLASAVDNGHIAKLSVVALRMYMVLLRHRNSLTGRTEVGQRRIRAKAKANGPGFARAMNALQRHGLVIVHPGKAGAVCSYEVPLPPPLGVVNGSPRSSVVNHERRCGEHSRVGVVNHEHKARLTVHHETATKPHKNRKQQHGDLHAVCEDGSEAEASNTLQSWGVDPRAIQNALRTRDADWLADLVQHCEDTDNENALRGATLDLARYAAKRLWHPELFDPNEPEPAEPSAGRKRLRGLDDEAREREAERRYLNSLMPGYGDMTVGKLN